MTELVYTRPADGMAKAAGRQLKFELIAERLRAEIRDGLRPPGSRLPTEAELARDNVASISTVRRAVDDLVAEGLVVRRQGSGTYVRAARTHSYRRTLIGVVVPSATFYYPRVLQGIEDVRAEADARVEFVCSDYDQASEIRTLEKMLEAGADGLLLVPTLAGAVSAEAYLRRLARFPVPVVLMERRGTSLADTNEYVCTHHEAGAFDAVHHLHRLGHRSIGLVLRSPSPTAEPVARGFHQAVNELCCVSTRFQAELEEWSPATADRCLARLRSAECTAAVCFGDLQAALLQAACRRAGLAVPADLALVAYDDEIADLPEVPLTAVSPPKRLLGATAARLLLDRIKDPDQPRRHVLLRPRITVRRSCGSRETPVAALDGFYHMAE